MKFRVKPAGVDIQFEGCGLSREAVGTDLGQEMADQRSRQAMGSSVPGSTTRSVRMANSRKLGGEGEGQEVRCCIFSATDALYNSACWLDR